MQSVPIGVRVRQAGGIEDIWKPIYWREEPSGEYVRIGEIHRLTGEISPPWPTCLQQQPEGMVE